jgi:hypothetical protein
MESSLNEDFVRGWNCLFTQIQTCNFLNEYQLNHLVSLKNDLTKEMNVEGISDWARIYNKQELAIMLSDVFEVCTGSAGCKSCERAVDMVIEFWDKAEMLHEASESMTDDL